jgi:hypothetical protein
MMVTLYHTGTEYVANAITMQRGQVSDITSVGVYHTLDPDEIPEVGDFDTVVLVDGINGSDPLAQEGVVDVLSLIGPRDGDVDLPTPGVYQRWVLLVTATEDIIRRPNTIEIL